MSCGGYALSLIPGTVNMQVSPQTDGSVQLYMPDPFLRGAAEHQDDDPFIAEIEALLPPEHEFIWLDDWEGYHIAWGEVHCGSNTRRTPIANWWEDALHLIDGGTQ